MHNHCLVCTYLFYVLKENYYFIIVLFKIEQYQQPPPLKSMRKPTVGVIDYKEKPNVLLKRKVEKVCYPSDEPVSGPNVTRGVERLRAKQSPGKKPWEWAGEEMYPGSSKPEKMIKELKYKLTRVQRKLEEHGKGGVRAREPRLAAEKRYGDLDFQFVDPPLYTARHKEQFEEERDLKARRKQWAERHKVMPL